MPENRGPKRSRTTPYRIARRSFVTGIGGAFGLRILLRNLEAKAEGVAPPPRFLMMHWPVGTIRTQFIPTGTGTSYVTSQTGQGPGYIIAPFDTPELRSHTIVLYGFNMNGISGQGGGHEDGTVFATTGARSPGTRNNGGETDDGCAGGPSWDQIFLKNVPTLSRRDAGNNIIGPGYVNAICDARVDSNETSTRCLSYGYTKESIASARPGGTIQQNQPLRPERRPCNLYNTLFSGFSPSGALSEASAAERLAEGGSVLDDSKAELARLSTLAPASERATIDAHAEIIRDLERQLVEPPPAGCSLSPPPAPPENLAGRTADHLSEYGNPTAPTSDDALLEQVGQAHAGIIRAAFACGIIRVATFQWAPGTNHVALSRLDPNNPNVNYIHHALSHRVGSSAFYTGPRPTTDAYVWDAMVNANRWYFQKTVDIINQFRLQMDPLDSTGASLLERTIIPMVTEVGDPSHTRNGHAAIICGGRGLGMQGGQYRGVTGIHNQLWVTIAQAYLGAGAQSTLASEAYVKTGANPIPGLWVAPA